MLLVLVIERAPAWLVLEDEFMDDMLVARGQVILVPQHLGVTSDSVEEAAVKRIVWE